MSTGSQISYRSGVFPAVNLTEDSEAYYVRAELPGLKADMLEIEATGKKVSITGQRQIPSAGQNAKYHRRERESGRFSRVITVPGDIESAKVEASLSNGILTVTLPKAEEARPRQISIR
jgi:HSP20 family protein